MTNQEKIAFQKCLHKSILSSKKWQGMLVCGTITGMNYILRTLISAMEKRKLKGPISMVLAFYYTEPLYNSAHLSSAYT